MRTKSNVVFMETSQSEYDVIVLVETWLTIDFNDGEFFNTDLYNVFRKDRDEIKTGCSRGGGVLIAVKKTIKSMLLGLPNTDSLLDQLCVCLIGGGSSMLIMVSYIPPNSAQSLYDAHIENVAALVPQNVDNGFILLGDFNLPKLVWTFFPETSYLYANNVNHAHEINFIDGLCSFDLAQINPFYNSLRRYLDLIFISKNFKFTIEKCNNQIVSTDAHHVALYLNVELYTFSKSNNLEVSYDFSNCDFDLINQLISEIDWITLFKGKSVLCCYIIFKETIVNICRENIPLLKPKVYKIPWYTPGLKKLKNLRNKFHKAYKSTNSALYNQKYLYYSREFTFLNKFLYKQYVTDFESRIKNNPRAFWHYIESKKSRSDYPSRMVYGERIANSSSEKANLFANFFKSNFNLDSCLIDDSLFQTVKSVTDLGLVQISEADIISVVSNLKDSRKLDVDGIS